MTDTVDIGGTEYEVYASYATVDAYLNGSFSAGAQAWRASSDTDQKKRGMVQATRIFEATIWDGTKTDAAQDLQFPRTGLTYQDGTEVDPNTTPQQVIDAFCELTASIFSGVEAQNAANIAAGTRRLKAGSVEIEYFRAVPDQLPGPWPQAVLDLVGLWMSGLNAAATLAGGDAYGADCPSQFTRNALGYYRGI